MHFGENQLSRSLIGLSPLPTAHPLHFQLKWVRSSTRSYTRFNLAMGRSLRFGSRSRHSNALFRLAFAPAPPHGLTLPHTVTRRLILQKARHRGRRSDDALTACKPTVSGTISLPSRGTFHHSLTVLIHYRSSSSIQAYQVVLADSHKVSRAPCYSGINTRTADTHYTYGTITLSGPAFQPIHLYACTSSHQQDSAGTCQPHNPDDATPIRYHTPTGLAPSAFARHY